MRMPVRTSNMGTILMPGKHKCEGNQSESEVKGKGSMGENETNKLNYKRLFENCKLCLFIKSKEQHLKSASRKEYWKKMKVF